MENSTPSMKPFRGEADWHRVMKPALETSLIEQILHPENLHREWIRVKSNQGAPGIKGIIEDFPDYAQHHWEPIKQVKASVKQGYRGVVDIDLEKFYCLLKRFANDNVHHDVLICRVSRKVQDKTVLSLLVRKNSPYPD